MCKEISQETAVYSRYRKLGAQTDYNQHRECKQDWISNVFYFECVPKCF